MFNSENQLNVSRVNAFDDNYIWLIHSLGINSKEVIIVDPGEAHPVIETVNEQNLIPKAILITHHHGDHIGGVCDLLKLYDIPVYGPKNESIASLTHTCQADDEINFPELSLAFKVLDVPGHTRGHIAFVGHKSLFIGDTLFAGGCGRIFEGTPPQMHHSLNQLLSLDDDILVYCAHEYTSDNLQFAINVEPDNVALQKRIIDTQKLRTNNKATVPSLLGLEKSTNPFLRFNETVVRKAAEGYAAKLLIKPEEVFAVVRQWKDDLD